MNQELSDNNYAAQKQLTKFIHALSGIRTLSNIEIADCLEHELYKAIVKAVLTNIDMDSCSIFINENEELKCVSGISWDDHNHNNIVRLSNSSFCFKKAQGIIGKCAETKSLIHVTDCSKSEDYLCFGNSRYSKARGSLICAPLISNKQFIGVLNAAHPYPNFFEPWHEKVLMTYANFVAKLIVQHRLIHSMESEIYSRTRELQSALRESDDLKKRYQELSYIDYLTELHNRRYFFPELASNIANAKRHNQPLSLLVLDLDSFKMVNDTYGHELGDAVLIGVSQLLKRQIRKGDLLARLGGEEFVIALINTDSQGALQFSERLRIMVSELKWTYQNKSIQITTCIGVSTIYLDDENTENISRNMISDADKALYYCKENGKNQVKAYCDLEYPASQSNIH